MSDHDELRALLQRYARAADARDIDELTSLFHPDATVDGTRGRQSIADWLDTMRAPRTFPTSMHFLGEPLIDLDASLDSGHVDRGTLDTYAVVYQLGDEESGQADLTLGIHYLDEVIRHQRRWVFRRRVARTLWMR